MSYLDKLIPENSRVKLDYDNLIQKQPIKKSFAKGLRYVLGILLFISALSIFTWFWFGISVLDNWTIYFSKILRMD